MAEFSWAAWMHEVNAWRTGVDRELLDLRRRLLSLESQLAPEMRQRLTAIQESIAALAKSALNAEKLAEFSATLKGPTEALKQFIENQSP